MRIGDQTTGLTLERVEAASRFCTWRCEATAVVAGWKCAAVHDKVTIDGFEEAFQQMLDFSILQIPRVEIALSEGGWMRIKRDFRGRIVVRYRLVRLDVGAAVEGEVVLEAERADVFCRDLIGLLSKRTGSPTHP